MTLEEKHHQQIHFFFLQNKLLKRISVHKVLIYLISAAKLDRITSWALTEDTIPVPVNTLVLYKFSLSTFLQQALKDSIRNISNVVTCYFFIFYFYCILINTDASVIYLHFYILQAVCLSIYNDLVLY